MPKSRTYTSREGGLGAFFREFTDLRRRSSGSALEHADKIIGEMEDAEATLDRALGASFKGRHVLDVGCGQTFKHAQYLSRFCTVTGLDYDVVPRGFDPVAYLRLLRFNGAKRLLKTIGRKTLGVDRALRGAFNERLGPPEHPIDIVQGDAGRMRFDDASFEAVFSSDTFEHLPEPEAATNEIARVIKPGGIFFARTHLYTSDSGHHDLRLSKHKDWDGPLWGHLRPEQAGHVNPNAWVNKVSLADWRRIFTDAMPGAEVISVPDLRDDLLERLRKIRDAGELGEYSDDELLTVDVVTVWRKPAGHGDSA